MADSITIKAGDTEPLALTISATGVSTLDNLTAAVLYAQKLGASSAHVDGGTLTVSDSSTRTLAFDPVGQKSGGGDAFDAPGVYRCYVRATWSDADITRHPGDGWITVTVTPTYE